MLQKYPGPTFSTPCKIEISGYENGYCPSDYVLRDGEIETIFVTPLSRDANNVLVPDEKPGDYTDKSTFGNIMMIRGFGTKALPTETTYVFPGGMEFPIDRDHNLVMSVTNMKKANLDVIRAFQSGLPVAIWYHTRNNGHSFGGPDGIQCIPRNVGRIHESGGTMLSGQIAFQWNNLYEAEGDLSALIQPEVVPFTVGNPLAAYKAPSQRQGIDATQSAIDLANENEINIQKVFGTGAGGRITKSDVEAAIQSQSN